ncbi:MAG: DUF4214 domain-containing protein [Acidobacteriota bacterium]|nr:DUF4214 domain-containing protein [Acidobacteriota bacterium]
MRNEKAMIRQIHNLRSYLSSAALTGVACVALLAAISLLAAAPALAGDDEVIIEAGLAGTAIGGQRPTGKAVFRERPANDRKLQVEVQDVNLAAGTVLNVIVGGQQVGTLTINTLRAGRLELETERGQAVPAVANGTAVAVRNQSGANIVSGAFGSAAPTPTPGASPSPTATPTPSPSPNPSPSPSPGATPSPTPGAMNEIEADLVGAPIGGIVPRGDSEFEIEGANREFRVRIENVNLPAGTQLRVFVDGTFVGNIFVAADLRRSEFRLKTEDGQAVPPVNSRTRVVVADASDNTIVAGSFSNIAQPLPNPGPAPMPTPDQSGEVRIESRLAGAPINGLTPTGHARFRKRGTERKLNVEVEKLNLPAGTQLQVFVDDLLMGTLTLGPTLEAELERHTNDGQFVPEVTTATRVVVTDTQGHTLLSGGFNTAGLPIPSGSNDIDNTTFFVEQQYRDFLFREADDGGLNFWSNEIVKCGGGRDCVTRMRANTSAAFFLSIEFQETGYLLYRLNKASYGTMPRRNQFLVDMQAAVRGVVVGTPGWQQRLEANKAAAVAAWVARPEFKQRYDGLSNEQYVDALLRNAGLAGDQQLRQSLLDGLNAGTRTRASALRTVADHASFRGREQNPAFVLMQYFGYLHRNPNEGPDVNMDGFNFWLKKLNDNRGDFHRAEMVRAFIESIEYRERFQW